MIKFNTLIKQAAILLTLIVLVPLDAANRKCPSKKRDRSASTAAAPANPSVPLEEKAPEHATTKKAAVDSTGIPTAVSAPAPASSAAAAAAANVIDLTAEEEDIGPEIAGIRRPASVRVTTPTPEEVNNIADNLVAAHKRGPADYVAECLRLQPHVYALTNHLMPQDYSPEKAQMYLLEMCRGGRSNQKISVLRCLVDGADANGVSEHWKIDTVGTKLTALHVIAADFLFDSFGNPTELVQLLLNLGAEVDARTDKGVTPLNAAGHYERDKTVQLRLIKAFIAGGADINAKNNNGLTLLDQLACMFHYDNIEAVKFCLTNGAIISPRFRKKLATAFYKIELQALIEEPTRLEEKAVPQPQATAEASTKWWQRLCSVQ